MGGLDEITLELQGHLEKYDQSIGNTHKAVRQINKMMDDLLRQIQKHNSAELKTILKDLGEIAKRYRLLEYDTIALVQKTSMVCDDVRATAEATLEGNLTNIEAFQCMNQDFGGLSKSMNAALEHHSDIANDLKTQAEIAQEAKARNEQVQRLAMERRDDAQMFGIAAIPGVALFSGPIIGARAAAEAVDNKAFKVLAGFGGAVGGLLTGAVATVVSPLLAAWAIRCAVLGRGWSETFTDLSERILDVENAIQQSALYLLDVNTTINQLEQHVTRYKTSTSDNLLREQLKRIIESCKKLAKHCEEYRLSLATTRASLETKRT